MSPSFLINNSTDGRLIDTIKLRKFSLMYTCCILRAYFDNLLRRELSISMMFAACYLFGMGMRSLTIASCHTVFLDSIFYVFILCSKKQMAWINARRIVAFVTDKISIWDWAIDHLIRQIS